VEDGRPARHAQAGGQTGGTPVLHNQLRAYENDRRVVMQAFAVRERPDIR
jgi:hypothetical protein